MPAFSRDDLMALWKSVVDPGYSQPLLEQPNSGVELVEQAAEQLARASLSVERSTQSFYLKPWSGQTEPPATGAQFAVVTLSLSRDTNFNSELVLPAGGLFVEEQVRDSGVDGGQDVFTGRRYVLTEPVGFVPGNAGPIDAVFEAEKTGFGYNVPAPNTITFIDSIDAALSGSLASVTNGPAFNALLFYRGDAVPVTAIGQYIRFTAGANNKQVRLIVGYLPPSPGAPVGGVNLAATGILQITSTTGAFILGEEFTQGTNRGTVRAVSGGWLVYDLIAGVFATGALLGVQSAATATVIAVGQNPLLTPESTTAEWQLIGWGAAGLHATNADSPTGGASPELDMIGDERQIGRSPGETDTSYRNRVDKLPDTVSPNALIRAANRVLAPYGATAVLKEVGDIIQPFPGFFYDTGDLSGPGAYAYDLGPLNLPGDQFKFEMSLLESRAFFMVGVPTLGLGEFGFGWTEGKINFFDSAPYLSFYDGYAVTSAVIYRQVWDALNAARAAGVGFDLYQV